MAAILDKDERAGRGQGQGRVRCSTTGEAGRICSKGQEPALLASHEGGCGRGVAEDVGMFFLCRQGGARLPLSSLPVFVQVADLGLRGVVQHTEKK